MVWFLIEGWVKYNMNQLDVLFNVDGVKELMQVFQLCGLESEVDNMFFVMFYLYMIMKQMLLFMILLKCYV